MGAVVSLDELVRLRQNFRAEHKTVVFTNGCYDILHRGHVEYLLRAKALGDILIVGVNTDPSVTRIKGPKRPIVHEEDRGFIIAHLTPVDFVCLFEEDTPYHLIKAIVPDVLVKGADWNVDDIVGKDIVEQAGGKVKTIEFIPNRSTTNIIQEVLTRFK